MHSQKASSGLTSEQISQFMKLINDRMPRIGSDSPLLDAISRYLGTLCVDLEKEIGFGGSQKPTADRKAMFQAIGSRLGRAAIADDILGAMSRFFTVPEFIETAIEADVARLSVEE